MLRLARARRCSPRQILSDALSLLSSDPAHALATWARLARGQGATSRIRSSVTQWLPLPDERGWVTDTARHQAAVRADQAAESIASPPKGQRAVWDVVEQMAEVGRTAHADVQLAAEVGVRLHNPFADSRVIDGYLSAVVGRMPSPATYKPVLRAEMGGRLPASLLGRTAKGVYTPDYHLGLRAHLNELADMADGHLAELGLIDPALLVNAMQRAAAGVSNALWLLDAAVVCETWLRAHRSTPLPVWEKADDHARLEVPTT